MTGLAGTLANDLVYLAGNAPLVLLVMGALTSFVFGMGMTVTACYIFLAIVLAPPLIKAGLDPLAVHLFVMYWGMVSFITPPVALATFAAAPIAGVSAMRIGIQSIRLGTAIYLRPVLLRAQSGAAAQGRSADRDGRRSSLAFAGIIVDGGGVAGLRAGDRPDRPATLSAGSRALSMIAGGFLLATPIAAPHRPVVQRQSRARRGALPRPACDPFNFASRYREKKRRTTP